MSIKGADVLERILMEVYDGPPMGLPVQSLGDVERWHGISGEACARSRFASILHFWAHALHAVVGADSPDFIGLAENAMCVQVSAAELREAIAARAAPLALRVGGALVGGYRMFDDASRCSYVGENESGYFAFFWTHPASPPVRDSVVAAIVARAQPNRKGRAVDAVQIEDGRTYAWRVEAQNVRVIDSGEAEPAVRFRIAAEADAIDVECAAAGGWVASGRYTVEWHREVAALVAVE